MNCFINYTSRPNDSANIGLVAILLIAIGKLNQIDTGTIFGTSKYVHGTKCVHSTENMVIHVI